MNETQIYEGLTEVFHDLFGRKDIVLTPAMTANDIAGWDSYKQVEIILAVQMRFNIKVSSREIDKLANVDSLCKLIEAKTQKAAG